MQANDWCFAMHCEATESLAANYSEFRLVGAECHFFLISGVKLYIKLFFGGKQLERCPC